VTWSLVDFTLRLDFFDWRFLCYLGVRHYAWFHLLRGLLGIFEGIVGATGMLLGVLHSVSLS
jgi:hypothetical protein